MPPEERGDGGSHRCGDGDGGGDGGGGGGGGRSQGHACQMDRQQDHTAGRVLVCMGALLDTTAGGVQWDWHFP